MLKKSYENTDVLARGDCFRIDGFWFYRSAQGSSDLFCFPSARYLIYLGLHSLLKMTVAIKIRTSWSEAMNFICLPVLSYWIRFCLYLLFLRSLSDLPWFVPVAEDGRDDENSDIGKKTADLDLSFSMFRAGSTFSGILPPLTLSLLRFGNRRNLIRKWNATAAVSDGNVVP